MEANSNTTRSRREKNLTSKEKQVIYEFLLKKSVDGRTGQGSVKEVATMFSISPRTIRRIWQQSRLQMMNGNTVDLSTKNAGKVGRKCVHVSPRKIKQVPLNRRSTVRSLAKAISVSKTTVHRRVQEGLIRPHTNAVKPTLTEDNKRTRLEFCLSQIDPDTLLFSDMFNVVHIDEKWFYMCKTTTKYYLVHDEPEPTRRVKSKRFITKAMFLAAVARPRNGFSGKIGIFPFTFIEPAKRNSKNRVAGTMVTKVDESITKEKVKSCLIEKVIPAIHAKWPQGMRTIIIQQDNAKPHIDCNNAEFMQAASKDGFDIRLICQPPNSPDLNVLDLGFFRSIQDLQHEKAPTTIEELVAAVKQSFDEYPVEKLNRVFLTQQTCMKEIMKFKGDNDYKIPHMGKDRLEREGTLPLQIRCESDLVNDVVAYLEEQEQ